MAIGTVEHERIMEYPISDLLDRLSILRLKFEHLGSEVQTELKVFESAFDELKSDYPDADLHLANLLDVNREIWGYEADLRNGKLDKYQITELNEISAQRLLQLAAIGDAAVRIRNANRRRKQIMNRIVEDTGTGWKDVKVNHASEEV